IGWAARSAEALQNGSDGLIPSTGNLYPKLYDDMYRALEKENAEKAFQLQKLSDQLGDLYQKGRLLGESLWALKVLMQEAGICKSTVMPPLQPLADENCLKKELHRLVKEQGIQL
ncbi:MAG TPA: dihydrodipicolinate synthase family protein, partial [Flavisolibacter sp.]|nr:dihydrodipicolinate synthase family protein [Flavisolibacter sp.]